MRIIAASVVVLLLGLIAVAPARADHPLSFLRKHDCGDASCKHPLWPFGGKLACHPLFNKWAGGHPLGAGGHPFHHVLGCQYHPWFNTYKHGPGPESAFPQHPFVRSPRDFFMYE